MMTVLLQALAVASIGIVAPGSITLVILLLMSDRGWRNGLAFASGYVVMYSLIGASILVSGVGSAENTPSPQSPTTSYILIGLGVVLIILAIHTGRKKPESPADGNQPARFARLIDGITPIRAFGLAAVVSVVNMKNLTIFLSAVSVLLFSRLALATKLTMLIPLVLVFCTSVITPIAIYLLFPARAYNYLFRIKDAIGRYSRTLGVAVTLILGCLFLYRGLTGLL